MEFLRILWRGARDTYEQFAFFMLLSFAFWLCMVPALVMYVFTNLALVFIPLFLICLIPIPPALVTLSTFTDPRRALDRPEWKEVLATGRSVFVRSWKLAATTLVPLLMIGWNIRYFAGSDHTLAILVPLWVVMWVFLFVLTQYCFSLAGTMESGLKNAWRGGMFVLVKNPFRALFLSLFILVFGYMTTMALLPMLIIGPPFFAAIVNRFVFDAFDVYVLDPNSPTDEREWERQRGINQEKRLIDRVLRRN